MRSIKSYIEEGPSCWRPARLNAILAELRKIDTSEVDHFPDVRCVKALYNVDESNKYPDWSLYRILYKAYSNKLCQYELWDALIEEAIDYCFPKRY